MDTEFEAKSVKIDKTEIREKLKSLGAILVFPEKKFTRITFDNPELKARNAWVRIRNEGEKTTMSFKIVENADSASGMKEASVTVSDLNAAKIIMEQIGLKQKGYEENLREEWRLGDVVFDIDTWPMIDPYLEIEGPSEAVVKDYFAKLGLDFSQAYFGSADILYKRLYGIDILNRPHLLFSDQA